MGFRSRWVATRGGSKPDLIALVGLKDSGERSDLLDPGWWGLEVGDWFVVVGYGSDHLSRLEERHALAASKQGEAVFWEADDATLRARMATYADGRQVWTLQHDERITQTTGAVPEEALATLDALRSRQERETNGVDRVYEAAHIAGERLVGFRHDLCYPTEPVLWCLRPVEEPDTHRTESRKGPFIVRTTRRFHDESEISLELVKRTTVLAVCALTLDNGVVKTVIEHHARGLTVGVPQAFPVSPGGRLVVVYKGFLWNKKLEIELPPWP